MITHHDWGRPLKSKLVSPALAWREFDDVHQMHTKVCLVSQIGEAIKYKSYEKP